MLSRRLEVEVFVLHTQDVVHQHCHVGHVDGSVHVHVSQSGACIEERPEGIDVRRAVGIAEGVVIVQVEDGLVALLTDVQRGVVSREGDDALDDG